MSKSLNTILSDREIIVSAPCRVDMGGTLDISTFYLPLRHIAPCTFNMALDLRTTVLLSPFETGRVKVSSRGFKSAEFYLDEVPFDHPLGLMFAIAAYFRAEGVHIQIESASPVRSALGGSSVAAVALIAALSKAFAEQHSDNGMPRAQIAALAQSIEASVAGVPCGHQDQLAAAFGGVNAWGWRENGKGLEFSRQIVIGPENYRELEERMLVAYCGIPHESSNINGRWVRQFLSGSNRLKWVQIAGYTRDFINAMADGDFHQAGVAMNQEVAVRRSLTPDVLDPMGDKLVKAAMENGCGARFTGAGGGGCIWGVGDSVDIGRLKEIWKELLAERDDAYLLSTATAADGIRYGY